MNQPLQQGLSAPLRVQPDMASRWVATDQDFDTAAEWLVQAHKADGDAIDQSVMDLRTWGLRGEEGLFHLAPIAGHCPPRTLRQTGFSNLTSRLGAPADFIKKLPAELQLANLNYLLASQPKPISAQLRLRGEEISAVVSDRYAPLDAEQFVESLRHALKTDGVLQDVRVRAIATGTTDALRLVLPGEETELKLGDVSHVGLDVSTSSFGKSAIHVSGVVFRLVCLNGLRSPESMGKMSFRHVGSTSRLQAGLRDAVPTALVHARGLMGHWQKAVTTHIHDVNKLIDRTRELTQGERQEVGLALSAEHHQKALPESTTAYNLVNAITQAAHKAEPARRLEMEGIAGRLLAREVA